MSKIILNLCGGTGAWSKDYINFLKGVNLLKQGLKKKVEEWWEDLDYPIKVELIEVVYPDGYPDADEGWHYLDWEVKLELYEENNPGVKV